MGRRDPHQYKYDACAEFGFTLRVKVPRSPLKEPTYTLLDEDKQKVAVLSNPRELHCFLAGVCHGRELSIVDSDALRTWQRNSGKGVLGEDDG